MKSKDRVSTLCQSTLADEIEKYGHPFGGWKAAIPRIIAGLRRFEDRPIILAGLSDSLRRFAANAVIGKEGREVMREAAAAIDKLARAAHASTKAKRGKGK